MTKDGKQEITLAFGINWNISKFIPAKIADKLPKIEVAVYIEGKGSYSCGCFDFCEASIGGVFTFGTGRRGGTSSSHKNLQGLDTQYTAVLGVSGEIKGTVNLCEGSFRATSTFVLTMGVSAPGFSLFGYGFNPAFEFNYTEEWEIMDVSISELAVLKPCA